MNAPQNLTKLDVSTIQAISLDLDDTLWPVWPTIRKAEVALLEWMQSHAPATAAHWGREDVAQTIREEVKAEHVDFAHDFSFLRTQMIARALREAGDDPHLADQAFEAFYAVRQQVDCYPEVADALAALASRYPLAAVSNGNANVLLMPIGRHFTVNVPAREAGFAKPDGRIFQLAAQRLGLPVERILHVGDDPALDVLGARAAGMQAVWLNREGQEWTQPEPKPVQIADLAVLRDLLGV